MHILLCAIVPLCAHCSQSVLLEPERREMHLELSTYSVGTVLQSKALALADLKSPTSVLQLKTGEFL